MLPVPWSHIAAQPSVFSSFLPILTTSFQLSCHSLQLQLTSHGILSVNQPTLNQAAAKERLLLLLVCTYPAAALSLLWSNKEKRGEIKNICWNGANANTAAYPYPSTKEFLIGFLWLSVTCHIQFVQVNCAVWLSPGWQESSSLLWDLGWMRTQCVQTQTWEQAPLQAWFASLKNYL